GKAFFWRLRRRGQSRRIACQEFAERVRAGRAVASGINAPQLRQAGEIHAGDLRGVSNEHHRIGCLQLIANLALAVAGIQQRGNGARQRGSVISNREFPAVPKKNTNHFSRLQACRDQSARYAFDEFAVFAVRDMPHWIGGGIYQCRLGGELLAGIENRLMKKKPGRVGVESPRWLHGRHFSSRVTGRISAWPASLSDKMHPASSHCAESAHSSPAPPGALAARLRSGLHARALMSSSPT